MQPKISGTRSDRLLSMRASHDTEMQRILRHEGVDLRPQAQPVDFQLGRLAPDEHQRITEAVLQLEKDTGRPMTLYNRILTQAELHWETDQTSLANEAARKVSGQLADAKSALANDRPERFDAIMKEAVRDSNAQDRTYQTRQREIMNTVSAKIATLDPSLPAKDREAIAATTVEMRPVPQAVLDLDALPTQLAEAQRAHERTMEMERKPSSAPSNTPSPSR